MAKKQKKNENQTGVNTALFLSESKSEKELLRKTGNCKIKIKPNISRKMNFKNSTFIKSF